ncbi:MAG: hypothetical protein HRT88_16175, partial [Lentisphaeraceae bacterium]|nr:hypothetical protein [Lentisphaeraceae bacterium]
DTGWSTKPILAHLGLRDDATYVGTTPLNWLMKEDVDAWKQSYATDKGDKAAIWFWLDKNTNLKRIMYGKAPQTFPLSSPLELPLFQNFSFTWFTSFERFDVKDGSEKINTENRLASSLQKSLFSRTHAESRQD